MILSEAVRVVKHHQSMLAANDPEYRQEYLADLVDNDSIGSGVRLAEAIEILLKGVKQDGQGKDYPRAS